MREQKDYYKILGIAKGAKEDEVKRVYRKLARKHHPDVNPGDPEAEERFKEIAEAYHVLGDKERRAAYDRGPEQFAQEFDLSDFFQQFGGGFGGAQGGGFSFQFGNADDIFAGFGGAGAHRAAAHARAGRPQPRQGRDVEVPLQLGFQEAIRGGERTVRYTTTGSSGPAGASSARVRLPAGVSSGKRIRVAGRGEPGSGGGPAGDLYLRITVQPHPLFRHEGSDLYVDLPVAVYEAGLGATIEVPTLDGSTTIKLPAGTRNGQVIRIAGQGAPLPVSENGRQQGDLYVTIGIELPRKLDAAGEELLRRFAEENPYNPRERLDASRKKDTT